MARATVARVMTDERSTDPVDVGTTPLSDNDIRDALPADLDASGYVGPYMFPNNNRRRIPAVLYWVIATGCLIIWFVNVVAPGVPVHRIVRVLAQVRARLVGQTVGHVAQPIETAPAR